MCFEFSNHSNQSIPLGNSLWPDCILLVFLKKIIDVVVVDFNVGHKDAVAAVFIHVICFARLRQLNHISNFGIHLLSKIPNGQFQVGLESHRQRFGVHVQGPDEPGRGHFGNANIFAPLPLQQGIDVILDLDAIFIV